MSDRDELIAKARELSAAACDGPWRHCCADGSGCGGVMVWENGDQEEPVAHSGKEHVNAKNNMAFIAESRTLLPALADLAESEGRRAEDNAKHCAELTTARNRLDEARARACVERDTARADLARLTERLRTMQHGETEALKMMGAEKQRADCLATEVNRYSQRELAYTHIEPPAEKLPAPLACPNCDRRDSWREFLGWSCIMRCEKEEGGCGYSMSLDANEPKNLRQARDLLRQEKTEANATLLRLRAESNEQRALAEVLARGLAAYRVGGYTASQVWENEEGHAVPR